MIIKLQKLIGTGETSHDISKEEIGANNNFIV